MRQDNKLPRPLNEPLGIKLSGWLCEVANKIAESEDIQEKLFSFPDLLEDSSYFDQEESWLGSCALGCCRCRLSHRST